VKVLHNNRLRLVQRQDFDKLPDGLSFLWNFLNKPESYREDNQGEDFMKSGFHSLVKKQILCSIIQFVLLLLLFTEKMRGLYRVYSLYSLIVLFFIGLYYSIQISKHKKDTFEYKTFTPVYFSAFFCLFFFNMLIFLSVVAIFILPDYLLKILKTLIKVVAVNTYFYTLFYLVNTAFFEIEYIAKRRAENIEPKKNRVSFFSKPNLQFSGVILYMPLFFSALHLFTVFANPEFNSYFFQLALFSFCLISIDSAFKIFQLKTSDIGLLQRENYNFSMHMLYFKMLFSIAGALIWYFLFDLYLKDSMIPFKLLISTIIYVFILFSHFYIENMAIKEVTA
jgi:hypothetical protein